ncbi:hypothetical protein [Escherichia coli]|uniref:hypothetical protein n=1 Tax=Escherichia coli TaxID=562 RepID=UPI001659D1B5|nr:hypothetical protein [Escherichia coli]EKW6307109.1 hypothetical protein [Escherichia coli]MBC9144407.1 hypothetical protein [Escherichia coli]MCG0095201.1 hypothetical protein [Escherichia coli]MCG0116807.1 hypothetical protein [Escherichia coli]WBZ41785.1 hypothetical protein PIC84_06880 [Escherichia coli]
MNYTHLTSAGAKYAPSRLGRQRHKAINQLRLTSWHLARLLAAVVRIQFDDVDVGH